MSELNPERLRIGFIPLCDAAALIVAADRGFIAAYDALTGKPSVIAHRIARAETPEMQEAAS